MGSKYKTMEEFETEEEKRSQTSTSGQGGTGKRAVYEPNGSQRCKQIVCSRTWAVFIVVLFSLLILAIALIAAFARPGEKTCLKAPPPETPKPVQPTVPTQPVTDDFPWQNIRLPRTVIPVSYDITLQPNLTTFLFAGEVSIDLQVQKATDFLVLHSKNLNITFYDLMTTENGHSRKVVIEEERHHAKHEQVYFKLGEQLEKRSVYQLVLRYDGVLVDTMMGFYRSSYTTSSGEKRWLATTQFEPTDARAAFPCFDEPELKATFQLSMVREKRHISLFNMPRINTEAYRGGLEKDHFEASVKMSTYLVAFVVCDFAYVQNVTSRGKKVSVYAPPEQVDQARFALDAAITVLEYYEEFFGIHYPLPKQDLIAIPDFSAGAMENWGLITYRMSALLYDREESMAIDQERVAIVEAHELAHQWFGNIVTMKWWNDLWLNEGFATFMEYIGADRINPEWKLPEQFVSDALLLALHEDSLVNSHPILVAVDDPAEINEIFDAISYSKGASIIRMLESVIGREALQKGLRDYLDTYKYSNAETVDLWTALARASDLDVKGVMDTWTLQMGYPMLEVSRYSTNTVIATQHRFLLNPQANDTEEFTSPFNYKWKIPLTYVTDKSTQGSSTIHWVEEDSVRFQVSDDAQWVKANVNFTGYYRVHYNAENWNALAEQLEIEPTAFSAADRVELIDDCFAMATAGHHSATVALRLANYLVKEKEYLPWKTALLNYGHMEALLETSQVYKDYKIYMQGQLGSMIGFLGWEEDRGEYFKKLLRSLVLRKAIAVDLPSAVTKAKAMFSSWMINGTRIPKELKKVVYTAGIKFGGAAEWDFCWKQYQKTQVPSEKIHLLQALAATQDAATLNRYLHMTLDVSKIRQQDTSNTIRYIAESAAGRVLAWRFIKQNWQEFDRRYGGGSFDMVELIKGVVGSFATQYDHDEVAAFFKEHPANVGKRFVAQALEVITMNMRWLDMHQEKVTEWFQNKVKTRQ